MKRLTICAITRAHPIMTPPIYPDTPILQNIDTEKYLMEKTINNVQQLYYI